MKSKLIIGCIALMGLSLYGCNQNQVAVDPATEESALSGARVTSDSAGFFCKQKLTKVATADLPATITSFISTSYAGATIEYAAKDDTGRFYVGIVQNSQPKALLFNADGTFSQEITMRVGKPGPGRGHGGKRDSLQQIAQTDLPAAITSYINTNYAGAQVKVAAKDNTRGYIVMITLNDQPKTLLFNLDGTFNKELEKQLRGRFTDIDIATLPTEVTSYISTTYAGSTVKKAAKNTEGQYIVWVQTSDNRMVSLLFAADGKFIEVVRRHR